MTPQEPIKVQPTYDLPTPIPDRFKIKPTLTLGGKLPPSLRDKAKKAKIIAEIDAELGRTRDPKKGKMLIKRLLDLS